MAGLEVFDDVQVKVIRPAWLRREASFLMHVATLKMAGPYCTEVEALGGNDTPNILLGDRALVGEVTLVISSMEGHDRMIVQTWGLPTWHHPRGMEAHGFVLLDGSTLRPTQRVVAERVPETSGQFNYGPLDALPLLMAKE